MEINSDQAAVRIKQGEIVAIPTETVYGLAADALNPLAVKKIYALKGRPSKNPIIVHVNNIAELLLLAENLNEVEEQLAKKFWPGPLTLILKKKPIVPNETSANLKTIAIRIPAHPLMRDLIEKSGAPIAAPSANISGRPSPTHHSHVEAAFENKIPVVYGGHCEHGLESTVVKVTKKAAYILRQGSISKEQISEIVNLPIIIKKGAKASPGARFKHYSPKTPLRILNFREKFPKNLFVNAGVIGLQVDLDKLGEMYPEFYEQWENISLGANDKSAAKKLYGAIIDLDKKNLDCIYALETPKTNLYRSVMERLERASEAK